MKRPLPFKGGLGWGWGNTLSGFVEFQLCFTPIPPPSLPLEGRGVVQSVFMRLPWKNSPSHNEKRRCRNIRSAPLQTPAAARVIQELLCVISSFAVRTDVQAFALFFFRHTQTDDHVHQFVSDIGHHTGPDQRQADRLGLNQ